MKNESGLCMTNYEYQLFLEARAKMEFNPSPEYIEKARQKFFKRGGKITRIGTNRDDSNLYVYRTQTWDQFRL